MVYLVICKIYSSQCYKELLLHWLSYVRLHFMSSTHEDYFQLNCIPASNLTSLKNQNTVGCDPDFEILGDVFVGSRPPPSYFESNYWSRNHSGLSRLLVSSNQLKTLVLNGEILLSPVGGRLVDELTLACTLYCEPKNSPLWELSHLRYLKLNMCDVRQFVGKISVEGMPLLKTLEIRQADIVESLSDPVVSPSLVEVLARYR